MNREIKFRAWDEEQNKMWVSGDGEGIHLKHFFDECDDLPIMQYTGLQDKNGVESYIGDIAKDDNGNIFEITDDYVLLSHLQTILFEVIGNICEHGHLLEGN